MRAAFKRAAPFSCFNRGRSASKGQFEFFLWKGVYQLKKEKMVGATGFEPATSCSQSKCSSQAELRSDAWRDYPVKTARVQRLFQAPPIRPSRLPASQRAPILLGVDAH